MKNNIDDYLDHQSNQLRVVYKYGSLVCIGFLALVFAYIFLPRDFVPAILILTSVIALVAMFYFATTYNGTSYTLQTRIISALIVFVAVYILTYQINIVLISSNGPLISEAMLGEYRTYIHYINSLIFSVSFSGILLFGSVVSMGLGD